MIKIDKEGEENIRNMLGSDKESFTLALGLLEDFDYKDPITVFYISSLLLTLYSSYIKEYNSILTKLKKSPYTDKDGDIILDKEILKEITP